MPAIHLDQHGVRDVLGKAAPVFEWDQRGLLAMQDQRGHMDRPQHIPSVHVEQRAQADSSGWPPMESSAFLLRALSGQAAFDLGMAGGGLLRLPWGRLGGREV
jgi:hypothetical protein